MDHGASRGSSVTSTSDLKYLGRFFVTEEFMVPKGKSISLGTLPLLSLTQENSVDPHNVGSFP